MEPRDALPADALDWRRFRALHSRREGWSRRDIAEAPGASPVSVARGFARVRDGGPEALRARPAPGRPPKLSPAPTAAAVVQRASVAATAVPRRPRPFRWRTGRGRQVSS